MYISDKLRDAVICFIGSEIEEKLGSGHFGTAYLLKNGKVLKITDDHEEYATAIRLKEQSFRHIVKIYDSFRMTFEGKTFYVVIREYLESANELKEFDDNTDFNEALRNFFDRDTWRSEKSIREKSQEVKERYPNMVDIVEQYWGVFDDCKRAGFTRLDIKADNLGFKGGILQLIDTGWSGISLDSITDSINLEPYYYNHVQRAV